MKCWLHALFDFQIISQQKHIGNYGKISPAKPADVAQLAEHITRNNEVMGSIPIIGLQKNSPAIGEFFS